MLKIRRPLGRLIFNMGIAIPGKTVFLIETAPRMISVHCIYFYISYKENIFEAKALYYLNIRLVVVSLLNHIVTISYYKVKRYAHNFVKFGFVFVAS